MSVVLIEIGIFAGIAIGIIQVCLMVFRRKKKIPDVSKTEKDES